MATIANSVSTVTITSGTVDNAVGICYFDPVTESLLEISSLPNHYLTVEPNQQVIRKYYVVVAPGEIVSYVKVKVLDKESISDKYSIKLIIGTDSPTSGSFVALPDFNSFKYVNPVTGDFIPLWVLVTAKTPINEVVDIGIELEYE